MSFEKEIAQNVMHISKTLSCLFPSGDAHKFLRSGEFEEFFSLFCDGMENHSCPFIVPTSQWPLRRYALLLWRFLGGDLEDEEFRSRCKKVPQNVRDFKIFCQFHQPQPPKEIIMDKDYNIKAVEHVSAFKKVTLVYGVDIKKMSPEALINAIQNIEGNIGRYAKLAADSKYLTKRKTELLEAIKEITAELDSRTE